MIDIIGDPNFYGSCHNFLYLKELGLECYNRYMEQKRTCIGCKADDLIKPALEAVTQQFIRVHKSKPMLLRGFLQYLQARQKYQVDQVVLLHKVGDEIQSITF